MISKEWNGIKKIIHCKPKASQKAVKIIKNNVELIDPLKIAEAFNTYFSNVGSNPAVVDRRIYTRIFQFPLRINVKISEHAPNFNVFKPRLVCRRILISPSGSSGNSQKSEILKNLKFSKI